jgi:hypothetical protein
MNYASTRRPPETAPAAPPTPWWRVGMVWLVLGGPAVVVLAALVTAVIAVRGADPVVGPGAAATTSDLPAVQGRNHAATPSAPR